MNQSANTRAGVEEALLEIEPGKALPRHVAIIMDGNGRWARQRHLARLAGHRAAVRAVRETVEEAARLGLTQLTLYAFSTENWQRPRAEVAGLMQLYRHFLISERPRMMRHNIRFVAIGREDELPESVRRAVEKTRQMTAGNTGLTLCVAVNYGSHREITDAARRFAQDALAGRIDPTKLTEELFAQYLYTAGMPDVDLLIRTAGEMRVSNFLLWQLWYAELCVLPICWPDFRAEHLRHAIATYQRRRRTFGRRPE